MNHLQQLIESREQEFKKEFVIGSLGGVMPKHRDGGMILKKELEAFLSESIRLAYLSGLERAKELVGDERKRYEEGNFLEHRDEYNEGYNKSREETLQNIDNEIKSL